MPSGRKLHASVAQAASAVSASMPAAPIDMRWRRQARRQAPDVSVYSTGHMTMNATPMVATRQPWCLAAYAWPSSCSTLAAPSVTAAASAPSSVKKCRKVCRNWSHWRAARNSPSTPAASVRRKKTPDSSARRTAGSVRSRNASGRTSGMRKNRYWWTRLLSQWLLRRACASLA
ncbi:hypothetical protein D3C72_1836090 [compost metagenome]